MAVSSLDIAKLRNARKQKLPAFDCKLKELLEDASVDYFDFEKGICITKDVFSSRKYQKSTGRMSREEAVAYLHALENKCADDTNMLGILLLSHHEYVGGVCLPLKKFLINAMRLLDFDGDTVFFVDDHVANGLMLDKDDEGYEIYTWGLFEV